MNTFALFTAEEWKKNNVKPIEHGGEISINQGHLQKKLDIANIADRTQYYSSEFKKMKYEIQKCGKYQPCRVFIDNTLTVEITMSSVKTQAAIFREKFGVKQHDKVLRQQQSLVLRLKKLLPRENITEEYLTLHYRTDFTFKKYMLVVKIDEKGHNERPPSYKKERQEDLENVGYSFIRIKLDKPSFHGYEEFGRVSAYIAESIKKQTEKSTKKSLIDDLLKTLPELEFKSNHPIKAKCLKWIVKKILPDYKE